MFPYFEFVIACTAIEFIIELYLDWRNYTRLQQQNRGVITKKQIIAVNYNSDKLRAKMFLSVIFFIQNMFILGFHMSAAIWNYSPVILQSIGAYINYEIDIHNEITRMFIYSFIVDIYGLILKIPTSAYFIFVIEERYGFNKTTPYEFAKDLTKSVILNLIIFTPLMYIFAAIITFGGEYFWLYLWLSSITIGLCVSVIYMNWIAPLFNSYTILGDGELRDAITNLANEHDFPVKRIFVVDSSTRTNHSNAYMYGFGQNKKIVLYDTLIKQLNTDEIVAVLAHEICHWKESHGVIEASISGLYALALLYAGKFMINDIDISRAFNFDNACLINNLSLFLLVISPVSVFIGIMTKALSRHYEYVADAFAARRGYNLASALIKTQIENMGNDDPDPWYSAYYNTHPTTRERIAAIEKITKKTA
jgi:STE24 endopeptidase